MALEKELEAYKQQLPALVAAHPGKFALIKGDRVVGVLDSYADALREGYQKFGLESFLVKQINLLGDTHFFTRDISPCRT
ncbi:MAG: hypothetical protein FWD53_05095 [Phycisphaerales bacterium]|nr:hypothetical protein [Phycisphaerales bacterium]